MLPKTVLAVLAELAPAGGDRVYDVTRGGQPLVWIADAERTPRTAEIDRLAALDALLAAGSELAEPALERFHALFAAEPLVIDKWFSIQARAPEAGGRVFERVQRLLRHPDFSIANPNRARSLLMSFCMFNPAAFHRPDGAGYAFWAERVIEVDAANPQLAARLARTMDRWSMLAAPYRAAARTALARVAAAPRLSGDVREIVERSLAA